LKAEWVAADGYADEAEKRRLKIYELAKGGHFHVFGSGSLGLVLTGAADGRPVRRPQVSKDLPPVAAVVPLFGVGLG